MTTRVWILTCIGVIALCGIPSHSFSTDVISPISRGGISNSLRATRVSTLPLYGTSDDEDGGTGWIKKAMGSEEGGGGSDASPPSNGSPEFTQDEIDHMDQLIVSLSKESNDDKRRERLAGILDQELADAAKSSSDSEIPRFAELFQLSLDAVGGEVQAAAREKAEQQQQNLGTDDSENESEGGDVVERVKSPEELQLWALIDMMVQSKTRIKLHMGSLGSKGEFR
ncbi:hypothetical protein ACHAXR_000486 [Thalassiosira sp. AJA248-18]